MIHIAICDGNVAHLKEIERCLVAILFDQCDFEINRFTDNEKLLPDILKRVRKYDLIVTEQNTTPYSGMELAKALSQNRTDTEVIFLTEDSSLALEGYKYRLFDYLVKPVSFKTIKNTINRYIASSEERYSHFAYKSRGVIKKIKIDEVIYFESDGRKINIHTAYGCEEYYDRLDAIEDGLKVSCFVRVHQSYLVNLHYIKNVTKKEVILEDGELLPVSRGHQSDVIEKVSRYIES